METVTYQPTTEARTERPTHRTGVTAERAIAVAAAAAGALITFLVVEGVLGHDLMGPTFDNAAQPEDIGLANIGSATAVATMLGWALLAGVVRATANPKTVWTTIAVVGLVVTLAGPLSGSGVEAADRIVLVILHLVVGVIYIPLMRRTIASNKAGRA